MPDLQNPRVAVYLDFDNIVMSWYDRVHGKNSYSRDRQKIMSDAADPAIAERLAAAMIDVGAIIDYATSMVAAVRRSAISGSEPPAEIFCRSREYEFLPCTRSYQDMTMLSKSR